MESDGGEPDYAARANSFRMLEGDTLAGVLARYEEVATRTDELIASLPDPDASHAPARGALVRARRPLVGPPVFVLIVAETAQHAGHADILRESIDGQKTMG